MVGSWKREGEQLASALVEFEEVLIKRKHPKVGLHPMRQCFTVYLLAMFLPPHTKLFFNGVKHIRMCGTFNQLSVHLRDEVRWLLSDQSTGCLQNSQIGVDAPTVMEAAKTVAGLLHLGVEPVVGALREKMGMRSDEDALNYNNYVTSMASYVESWMRGDQAGMEQARRVARAILASCNYDCAHDPGKPADQQKPMPGAWEEATAMLTAIPPNSANTIVPGEKPTCVNIRPVA